MLSKSPCLAQKMNSNSAEWVRIWISDYIFHFNYMLNSWPFGHMHTHVRVKGEDNTVSFLHTKPFIQGPGQAHVRLKNSSFGSNIRWGKSFQACFVLGLYKLLWTFWLSSQTGKLQSFLFGWLVSWLVFFFLFFFFRTSVLRWIVLHPSFWACSSYYTRYVNILWARERECNSFAWWLGHLPCNLDICILICTPMNV